MPKKTHFKIPVKTRPKTPKATKSKVVKQRVLLILAVKTNFLIERLFFLKATTPSQRVTAEKNGMLSTKVISPKVRPKIKSAISTTKGRAFKTEKLLLSQPK